MTHTFKETIFLCIIFIITAVSFCLWIADERQANAEVKNEWSPAKTLNHLRDKEME